MYGFAAGIAFIAAASSGESNTASAALAYNYPTVVILLMNDSAFSGIAPMVHSAALVMISAGVWTLIASFFYGIFKMFKIAKQMEENQNRD